MKQQGLDLSRFSDSLARKTAWDSLGKAGAANRGHRPVLAGTGRLEFRPTLATKLTYLVFFTLGGGMAAAAFAAIAHLNISTVLLLLGGLCLCCASLLMLYRVATPIVFDKRSGSFWKGRQAAGVMMADRLAEVSPIQLDDIHAVQIIAKHSTEHRFSYSYPTQELNLILKDGNREHVVDAASLDQIRKDAQTLGMFLEKPVWDATAL